MEVRMSGHLVSSVLVNEPQSLLGDEVRSIAFDTNDQVRVTILSKATAFAG
jgi:hypothetical protein